jgi:hypothetical protein
MKTIKFLALFYLALASIQALGMETHEQDSNSPLMETTSANISPMQTAAPITTTISSRLAAIGDSVIANVRLLVNAAALKECMNKKADSDDESDSSSDDSDDSAIIRYKHDSSNSPIARSLNLNINIDEDDDSSSDDSDDYAEIRYKKRK